jgi:2'-5' RNA ligase
LARTAIVIAVPEAEPAVGLLRRRHTLDGAQGMPPHVTLLIPFADTDDVPVDEVRAVIGDVEPFDFELTETRRFESADEAVVWLAPVPAEPFVALTEALVRAFPEYQPYGGEFADVVPHLTVAATRDRRVLDAIEREVAAALPIHAQARAISIVQEVDGRWLPHTTIPLADR